MIEVELKAWLSEPETVEKNIEVFAEFFRDFIKQDQYWMGPVCENTGVKKGCRIRQDESRMTVTYKSKQIRNSMEINQEFEFDVSDLANFTGLLKRLKCELDYTKRKTGKAWKYKDYLIEVFELETLGWFIEIETVLDSDNKDEIRAAQEGLKKILGMAGVPLNSIESRTYSELLRNCHAS